MVTVITWFNASTQQYYIRLHPGIIEENEKEDLCKSMNSLQASKIDNPPSTASLLYFQEFDKPDSKMIYFNIDGDREIHDIFKNYGKDPEYII